MIPKRIHYCWFGNNKKNDLILECIDSWKRNLPGYDFVEWNEDNFNVLSHTFTRVAYSEKKWAFVSDYARLWVLQKEGGIYLDTDMFVLKPFDDFLHYDLVLGKEDSDYISAGMIASIANSKYIAKVLDEYDHMVVNGSIKYVTIPKVLTKIHRQMYNKLGNVKIFERDYFYPFSSEEIYKFNKKNAPMLSYAVHMWDYSWGHPVNKFLKKIGVHNFLVKFLEIIGVKYFLKKFFGMI